MTYSVKRSSLFAKIYFWLLLGMAASLPLSKALMSIIPGLLLANWIAGGDFIYKFRKLKERRSLQLLISIFFIYLLALAWTSSLKWGLHDIKIQLPLLVLPLVIGTSGEIGYKQVKTIVYVFSAAVLVASFCSIATLLGLTGKTITDPREMSLFISHIRFSLLINISIFSLGWYSFNQEKKGIVEKIILLLAICWLTVFLVILKSATGWVVFIVVFGFVLLRGIFKLKKLIWKVTLSASLVAILLTPVIYIGYVVKQFYKTDAIPENLSSLKTSLGNGYINDLENKQVENGHYVFLFVQDEELREAWAKRSRINFDSTTASGYNQYVLLRYMTSKGLKKDADGVAQLSDQDIKNIENGMTNYLFQNPLSLYLRIYQIIWETDNYMKGGNPAGHSVTQRWEYYKMAFNIIGQKFWFGHGTGGYYEAYQHEYNQNKFFQGQEYRQRSHNMFLSYWIDFGLIGLVYICFAMFSPIFMEKKAGSFLLISFILIVLLSFLNEDSLNNHDAISFFAFFYPLYLYSRHQFELKQGNLPDN